MSRSRAAECACPVARPTGPRFPPRPPAAGPLMRRGVGWRPNGPAIRPGGRRCGGLTGRFRSASRALYFRDRIAVGPCGPGFESVEIDVLASDCAGMHTDPLVARPRNAWGAPDLSDRPNPALMRMVASLSDTQSCEGNHEALLIASRPQGVVRCGVVGCRPHRRQWVAKFTDRGARDPSVCIPGAPSPRQASMRSSRKVHRARVGLGSQDYKPSHTRPPGW